MVHFCYFAIMTTPDPERDLSMDAYRLAEAIRSAARWLVVGMILLGLMIWQPWASPKYREASDYRGKTTCVTYKDSLSCPR